MNPAPTPRLWPFVLLIAAAVTLNAALTTGGTAYTKRLKTKLLSEPKPSAASTGEIGFAKPLTIATVQGSWLQVSSEGAKGWVFNGYVSATKPAEGAGADNLGWGVSETTASAAARPLTPAAAEYAKGNNLVSAQEDLNWLVEQSAAITNEDVQQYMQAQKRGEYK